MPDALDEDGFLRHHLSDAALALRALLAPQSPPPTLPQAESNLHRAAQLGMQLSVEDFIGLRWWKRRVERSGSVEVQGGALPDGTLTFTLSPDATHCAMHWTPADAWDELGRAWVDGQELTASATVPQPARASAPAWLDETHAYARLRLPGAAPSEAPCGQYAVLLWDAHQAGVRRINPPPNAHWPQPRIERMADGRWLLYATPGAAPQALAVD